MAPSLYRVVWQQELLSTQECAGLIASAGPWSAAMVTDDDGVAPTVAGRKRASWALLPLSSEHEWLYERLAGFLAARASFGFELREIESPLKIQRYAAGDFHGWHADLGAPEAQGRKVGISVQLSGGDQYEGGELRFFDPPEHATAPRTRGCAIGFPSYLPHEVAPVTAGTRYALTAWAVGPSFR